LHRINPVRIIDLFVEGLDLNKLQFIAKGKSVDGRPAYDNKILLKLYLYGYLNRIRTSRLLQRECERNVELMWLLGNLKPCFRTIAGFRSDNKTALQNLFKHFVQMIRKWNLVAGDTIAIDSSKFRAVNSKKNNFNPAKIERQLKYIDDKIDAYLKEMEQADAADDKDHGDTLNAGIITQLNRKVKYNELKEK
jgi:transposase